MDINIKDPPPLSLWGQMRILTDNEGRLPSTWACQIIDIFTIYAIKG